MEGKINRIETLTCRPMRFYGLSRFYDEHNIPCWWLKMKNRLGESLKTSNANLRRMLIQHDSGGRTLPEKLTFIFRHPDLSQNSAELTARHASSSSSYLRMCAIWIFYKPAWGVCLLNAQKSMDLWSTILEFQFNMSHNSQGLYFFFLLWPIPESWSSEDVFFFFSEIGLWASVEGGVGELGHGELQQRFVWSQLMALMNWVIISRLAISKWNDHVIVNHSLSIIYYLEIETYT